MSGCGTSRTESVIRRVAGGETATTAGASARPARSPTGKLSSFRLTGQPAPSAASRLAMSRPMPLMPPVMNTTRGAPCFQR